VVLFGESDRVTPAASAERILLGVPQARMRRIPGAAHLSNIEQAEIFDRLLLDFLGG
jgi:3-oxoadipate enol-lactonase